MPINWSADGDGKARPKFPKPQQRMIEGPRDPLWVQVVKVVGMLGFLGVMIWVMGRLMWR